MDKQYIKIDRWFFPIQGVTFHLSHDVVEVFQLGSTKLLFTYEGEQAKVLHEWLIQQAVDLTLQHN